MDNCKYGEMKMNEQLEFKEASPKGKYAYKCELFGSGNLIALNIPPEFKVPNRFWRWMQYLILGNKWIKL